MAGQARAPGMPFSLPVPGLGPAEEEGLLSEGLGCHLRTDAVPGPGSIPSRTGTRGLFCEGRV